MRNAECSVHHNHVILRHTHTDSSFRGGKHLKYTQEKTHHVEKQNPRLTYTLGGFTRNGDDKGSTFNQNFFGEHREMS
jgi:hypothetical protein